MSFYLFGTYLSQGSFALAHVDDLMNNGFGSKSAQQKSMLQLLGLYTGMVRPNYIIFYILRMHVKDLILYDLLDCI